MDPVVGLISNIELETWGEVYLMRAIELLSMRNQTETMVGLLKSRLAIDLEITEESDIQTDIEASDVNLTRWENPDVPKASANTVSMKAPDEGILLCVTMREADATS
jgi:hypothetical protein